MMTLFSAPAGLQSHRTRIVAAEKGIEIDFKDALKKRDGLEVDKMTAKSAEELEAEAMMKSGTMPPGTRVRYITKEIKTLVDDNPRFTSSMRMASPAPVGHFLRVFGQTDRGSLDERRDHSPSMRQALMMLNGKLTNEAARVGALEPVAPLITGPKADVDAAIKMAYREILTREPTTDEITDAKAVIAESFERIHRSNLVNMGVLPLEFKAGASAASLKLTGTEEFTLVGVAQGLKPRGDVKVVATAADGTSREFAVTARIDTPEELVAFRHGGILPYVVRQLVSRQ